VDPVADGAETSGNHMRVYDIISIEAQPSFPEGMNKFYAYLRQGEKYPTMTAENNIKGKVLLCFVVEKNVSRVSQAHKGKGLLWKIKMFFHFVRQFFYNNLHRLVACLQRQLLLILFYSGPH